MSEQTQEQNKVAMVIVAHPDDAEFGAAGTAATWAREGWEIYFVICTDAAGGGPDDAIEHTGGVTGGSRAGQRHLRVDAAQAGGVAGHDIR